MPPLAKRKSSVPDSSLGSLAPLATCSSRAPARRFAIPERAFRWMANRTSRSRSLARPPTPRPRHPPGTTPDLTVFVSIQILILILIVILILIPIRPADSWSQHVSKSWKTLLPMKLSHLLVVALALSVLAARGHAQTVTLPKAHAHNDYEHPRPLFDALDQGFCSVEADIYLVDGRLLVAHDRPKVRPDRTLEALYLDPLLARVKAHGGRVHPGGPPVTLLVDIKADAEATYARLKEVLAPYRTMLTVFRPDRTETNAVTIILSGDRPWKTMAAETERLAALDGRLPDLESNPSPHLVPLVSDNWRSHFRWNGDGPFPAEEKEKLRALVARAHQQGRRIRFWAAADRPEIWQAHSEAGVDFVNTDRLDALATYLRTPPPTPKP